MGSCGRRSSGSHSIWNNSINMHHVSQTPPLHHTTDSLAYRDYKKTIREITERIKALRARRDDAVNKLSWLKQCGYSLNSSQIKLQRLESTSEALLQEINTLRTTTGQHEQMMREVVVRTANVHLQLADAKGRLGSLGYPGPIRAELLGIGRLIANRAIY